jgi:hypothetical protein
MQNRIGWIRWLPGLTAFREYRAEWLPHDVIAGLVLSTMLVPVGMAYAVASGLPGSTASTQRSYRWWPALCLARAVSSSWDLTHRWPPLSSASFCHCLLEPPIAR